MRFVEAPQKDLPVRAQALAYDLFAYTFDMIDSEIEYTGTDAGFVANAVEKAFIKAMETFV